MFFLIQSLIPNNPVPPINTMVLVKRIPAHGMALIVMNDTQRDSFVIRPLNSHSMSVQRLVVVYRLSTANQARHGPDELLVWL